MKTTPGGHPILDFLPKCKVCERGEPILVQSAISRLRGYGTSEHPYYCVMTRLECTFCRMKTQDFEGNSGLARAVEAWTGQDTPDSNNDGR
jgi:hypothetical protein